MKNLKLFVLLLIASTLFIAFELCGQDISTPPEKIQFQHNENQLQGWFYKVSQSGPFPTLILLQGSVGKDGDYFNLGENLQKEGINLMTYNYPGSYRSEGLKTDIDALESVQSAIDFVKSDYAIQKFDIDTSEIILLGYSYGSCMALQSAVNNEEIDRIITIAQSDLSVLAEELSANPDARKDFQQMLDNLLKNPSLVKGTSGKDYIDQLIMNQEKFKLIKHAKQLAEKEILFIIGWKDRYKKIETNFLPLLRELQAHGADQITIEALDTGHGFSNVTKEINEIIIHWIKRKE